MSISRRRLITSGIAATASVAGLTVAGRVAGRMGLVPPDHCGIYGPGQTLTYAAQRLLTRHSLAREFPRTMISKSPFANPVSAPDEIFQRHRANGFSDWKVSVDGMVARPGSYSLSDVKSLPTRSQITEVACEEGWSYIAEWIGTPLSYLLREAGMLPQARYVVFYSSDPQWWDSVDLADALHPQTLLTWGMNDSDLPVPFGGPLRMRVPRQLGYKSVKFINRLTVTNSMRNIADGQGSSEPAFGYAWYAGI